MTTTRVTLAPVTVTAVRHTGPGTAEEIRALAEASTTRRPAFLPPQGFDRARVYLDDQRAMVPVPEGHWVVVVPSCALVVLSPDALASIRPAAASYDQYDHIRPGRKFRDLNPMSSTVLKVRGYVDPHTGRVRVSDVHGKRERPIKASSLRPSATKPNGGRYVSGFAPVDSADLD
ncbi:hypothetical protein Q8791_22970 [Nocardiopsis sp. CT-R113]|uniref:Uncharacterized protein n=1 Tax=Nocardiopsis codii TaxID=3065942 RepID=A0ABU7KCW7_9ACTN|nr:hypothetical protein [Nocardiopsis sp. CT-R113]MEE2040083.1 hypothetical protein [Nocardiopsis sp. CT-R113]